jgi:TRAP-type C4-dicarboxylate transport system substrate-binding protein
VRIAGAVLAMLFALAACQAPPRDGVTELTYATPYSPAHPFSRADRRWMDFVEERSGGTLRIRPIWSGALLSSEHSMVELRHGVADVGLITPIYVKGGAHLIRVQSGFYAGTRTIQDQVDMYRCIASRTPQIGHELEGLVVLAVQGGSTPGFITRERPVRSLADLRGLRIRVPTELLSVLRRLGADPVNMPMGEVYSAMAKGVIDGLVAPEDTFRSLHLAEVARYFTRIDIPRGAYPARAMARERWEALAEEHRRILEEGVAVWERALEEENVRALEQGKALALEEGIEMLAVSADDQQRFTRLYVEDAARNAEALRRYGIDGPAVLAVAQRSIRPEGGVRCDGRDTDR